MNVIAEMRAARRYITSVLLNLDLNANEMSLSTFIELLEHYADNPNDYRETIRSKNP